jgi:2-C-methyl-D-erythritol 2,4-cyclodiphosphate synthase
MIKTAIGQDSHAFTQQDKPLILAGVTLKHSQSLRANSDGDVIYHAVTNAISGITGINILGEVADELCQKGITNSQAYVELALNDLHNYKIEHLSISIECLQPRISPAIPTMKENLAKVLKVKPENIGITATTGEGLSAFGKGKGVQVFCILTVSQ